MDDDAFNQVVDGRDGRYLANRHDAYVGRSLILYGEYCEAEFQVLAQLCRPGAFVVEVGANVGAHSMRIAKRLGLGGRLVAYEPQPVICQALCGTLALNSLMNVEAYPYALGAEAGTVEFPRIDYRKANNFGGISLQDLPAGELKLPQHRLDDVYAYERLDVLKADVEGMELEVLQGSEALLERHRPMLYLENDQRDRSAALIRHLQERDYRVWWHTPPLYNPNNWFKNPENVFGGLASINVLAIHRSVNTDVPLQEVTDPEMFPLARPG